MNDHDAEYEVIRARYAVARKIAHAEARRQLAEELERRGVAQPKPRKPRMNRRTARLLRAGILAARDPELRQYVHLAPRLVREACRREMENVHRRRDREEQRELWALLEPTGDLATDMANRATFVGITGCLPQRIILGAEPGNPIKAEQAEHLRRFYA